VPLPRAVPHAARRAASRAPCRKPRAVPQTARRAANRAPLLLQEVSFLEKNYLQNVHEILFIFAKMREW
jgi:hypothetical protein